jgi:DNA-binding response OmpR family regulator
VLDYLEGKGKFASRQREELPALILLDINMPKLTGIEVLRWIRQSEHSRLVVIMFSGSGEVSDVLTSFEAGVNSYVHKPGSFHELTHVISAIHHYWFSCNYFPDPADSIVGKHRKEFDMVKVPQDKGPITH